MSIDNFEESWNGNFSKELLASWQTLQPLAAAGSPIGLAKKLPKAVFAMENMDSLANVADANATPGMESDLLTQLPSLKGSEVVIAPIALAFGDGGGTILQTLESWLQPDLPASWSVILARDGGSLGGAFFFEFVAMGTIGGAFKISMSSFFSRFTIHRVR